MATVKKPSIEGARELQRVMRRLPDDLQENVLGSVTRAGAKELKRVAFAHLALAMGSRSPREDDIIIRRRRNRSGKPLAMFDVGPPKRKPELRWLHTGTEPHVISAVTKYRTRRGSNNVVVGIQDGTILTDLNEIFGVDVFHPGQSPTRWLETAVFSSKDGVQLSMAAALKKSLPKQVKKLVSEVYRNRQLRKFIK